MKSILYVGMDVHTANSTLCTYLIAFDKAVEAEGHGPGRLPAPTWILPQAASGRICCRRRARPA